MKKINSFIQRQTAKNSKKGQMAILFAASLVLIIGLLGIGLDAAYIFYRQYQLQKALDAAVLNAVLNAEVQLNASKTNSEFVIPVVKEFLENAVKGNLNLMGVQFNSVKVEPGLNFKGSPCGTTGFGCDGPPEPPSDGSEPQLSPTVTGITAFADATMNIYPLFSANILGDITVDIHATACSRRVRAIISLVLDASGSMNKTDENGVPHLTELKRGVKEFVDNFSEALDYLSIVTFNTQGTVVIPMQRIGDIELTTSSGPLLGKEAIFKIIDNLEAKGATNLAEGIVLGRKEIEKIPAANIDPKPFRGIVIFSDGAPSAMTVPFQNRLEQAPDHLRYPRAGSTYNYLSYPDHMGGGSGWAPLSETSWPSVYDTSNLKNKYIYTYLIGSGNSPVFMLDPNNATQLNNSGVTIRSVNPYCSSDDLVFLSRSAPSFRDIGDCLGKLNYLDSKGEAMPPLTADLTSPWMEPRPGTQMGKILVGNPGSSSEQMTGTLFKEFYHLAIKEADHALKDGIAIYTIGLYSLYKPANPGSGGGGTPCTPADSEKCLSLA